MKNLKKRVLSIVLTFAMLFTMLPLSTAAIEDGYVYLSISYDGQYINDKNNNPIVYIPISLSDIAAVDLAAYGLDNMLFDADGDGEYETTALQLLIYAHEELYGGSWSDVNFDALPGSSYFKGGIFGFTENLMYFHNGDFPVDESQSSEWMTVGATSDRIVLEAGDFLDVASFECFSFLWDQLGGFHFFADETGNLVHDFTAQAGESLAIQLMHSFCDLMIGAAYIYGAADYEVYYGKVYGMAEGSFTADGEGVIDLIIDEPGTYYLWCYGGIGSDDGTHGGCDHYLTTWEPCTVSAPAYAKLVVEGEEEPEQARQPQDVSAVLNATMAQLAATVSAPTFGTSAGEWTVFSLARGEYFDANSAYFADYYNRIVTTVNGTAASVNLNGALDKNKSTENSRLIVALSSIGRDATSVGNWNLIEAYSANGINWIKKQGINGTIWTLIALDSGNYVTSDGTIRQQCVDSILEARHDDGGWSLITSKTQPSNVDITGMTLTALYPYRNQEAVAAACAEAIEWLSDQQLSTGGFPYGTGETSESCAWAIVALTTWGINPDTDARFIKNGKSAVDNLLSYYVESDRMFAHQGRESNAMATDQACYALVAYNRFLREKTALYDMSDVTFAAPTGSKDLSVSLGIPKEVENVVGNTFNTQININGWDNTGEIKLVDFIIQVPKGLSVEEITAGNRMHGGTISYHLEETTGKLRIVYFDANENKSLTISENVFPAEMFNIVFEIEEEMEEEEFVISIAGMSLKCSSDSMSEESQVIVNTSTAAAIIKAVEGMSFSAMCLYQGDDVDLIPSSKKAVAVAVTALKEQEELLYNDGEKEITFLYNKAMSNKIGVTTYVAIVDASMDMEKFVDRENYRLGEGKSAEVIIGDVNGDGLINAQDALATVNAWLRKGTAPNDKKILSMNVNGDSRINTFDALGIVEAFVNKREFAVIGKVTVLEVEDEE